MEERVVKVDGYSVADRLLEGVIFEVSVSETPDGSLAVQGVQVRSGQAAYFSQFNEAKFYQDIRDLVEDNIAGLSEQASSQGQTLVEFLKSEQENYGGEHFIDGVMEY